MVAKKMSSDCALTSYNPCGTVHNSSFFSDWQIVPLKRQSLFIIVCLFVSYCCTMGAPSIRNTNPLFPFFFKMRDAVINSSNICSALSPSNLSNDSHQMGRWTCHHLLMEPFSKMISMVLSSSVEMSADTMMSLGSSLSCSSWSSSNLQRSRDLLYPSPHPSGIQIFALYFGGIFLPLLLICSSMRVVRHSMDVSSSVNGFSRVKSQG